MSYKILLIVAIIILPFEIYSAQFSADIQVEMDGHLNGQGKIYVKDSKRRVELNMPQGERSVVVLDIDKNKGYILIDKEKSYAELENISSFVQGEGLKGSKEADIKGRELIDGMHCDIIQKNLGNGVKQIYWFSKELDFPILIETQINGQKYSQIKYINIQRDAINSELFNIPKGYKRLDSHQK